MFGIKVNGDYLVLSEGTNFTFEFFSSLFNDDTLIGGYSLPISAPVGLGKNDLLLSFGYTVNLRENVREFPCTYCYDETPLKEGTLYLLEFSESEYMLSISFAGIPSDLKDKKLKDVAYDDDLHFDTLDELLIYAYDCINASYPDKNLNFPEWVNQIFYGDFLKDSSSNPDFQGIVNFWDNELNRFHFNTINEDPHPDNAYNLVPWLYVHYVIKKIFQEIGWTVTGSFMLHPELQQLLLFNSYALDHKLSQFNMYAGQYDEHWYEFYYIAFDELVKLQFPNEMAPFYDPDAVWDEYGSAYHVPTPSDGCINPGYFEIYLRGEFWMAFNAWDLLGFLDEVAIYYRKSGVPILLCNTTAIDLFNGITETVYWDDSFVGLDIEFFIMPIGTDSHYTYFFQYRNIEIKINANSICNLNRFANHIHYANHVPDITVSEFLSGLKKTFNLSFYPNSNTKSFSIDLGTDTVKSLLEVRPEKVLHKFHGKNLTKNQWVFSWDFKSDAQTENNFKSVVDANVVANVNGYPDIPEAININDLVFNESENKYRTRLLNPTNYLYKDVFTDNFFEYKVGIGERKEIIPLCAPLFMYDRFDGAIFRLVPRIECTGNSLAFSIGISNEVPFRICFWRGFLEVKKDRYPLASSYVYNFLGEIVGNISLRWDDRTYGLFTQFYKGFTDLTVGALQVNHSILFDLPEFIHFNPHKCFLINGVRFFIQKASFSKGSDHIAPVEFELIKAMP